MSIPVHDLTASAADDESLEDTVTQLNLMVAASQQITFPGDEVFKTPAEIFAYNAGVADGIALVRRSSQC